MGMKCRLTAVYEAISVVVVVCLLLFDFAVCFVLFLFIRAFVAAILQ